MKTVVRVGSQDILMSVDYHDKNCKIRRLDLASGDERMVSIPTSIRAIVQLVEQARAEAGPGGGRVVWVQESTTGWARVKELLGETVVFELANVLQMPRPAKGRRGKTDKVDTGRIQREWLNGELPRADQPAAGVRQLRRVIGLHRNLVGRRTALRNWVNRYLAHEHWADRKGLWSGRGLRRLKTMELPASDRVVIDLKLEELEQTAGRIKRVEEALKQAYRGSPAAVSIDAIKGIGEIGAVCIVGRIGDIRRFPNAEHLIGLAGLAPGVHQSDGTVRSGHLARGGVDQVLRFYVLEATMWARFLPRYQPTYQRVRRRRGEKIGRIVVGRMLLRTIYKMLRNGVAFSPSLAAE